MRYRRRNHIGGYYPADHLQGPEPRPYFNDGLSINLAFVALHMTVSRRSPNQDWCMLSVFKGSYRHIHRSSSVPLVIGC